MPFGSWNAIVALTSAFVCLALAGLALYGDRRSLSGRIFIAAMIAEAAVELSIALLVGADDARSLLSWKRVELSLRGFASMLWLVFSIVYGRSNARETLTRRRWLLAVSAVTTLAPPLFFASTLVYLHDAAGLQVLHLGVAGKVMAASLLVVSVMILMNLEATLRAAVGARRWRMKFMVLGLGSWFAIDIYLGSQVLLYAVMPAGLDAIRAYAVLIGGLLIGASFARNPGFLEEVYVSEAVLYNSLIALLAGGYLIAVGLLADVAARWGSRESLPLAILVVFVALVALAILLLSEQLRQNVRRFVAQNFRRPHYDYRKEWTAFTQRTASVTEPRALCSTIARGVAETFGVSAVTVWLADDAAGASLGGSTILSDATLADRPDWKAAATAICIMVRNRSEPLHLGHASGSGPIIDGDFLAKSEIVLAMPLMAAGRFLGALAIGPKITRSPFAVEDLDLLRTVADQSAASLLSRELGQQLARAREMEALQTLSAFFVHDLKNLASMLSLTVQNLPANYDNPEFRADALSVISRSVTKMNAMCGQLSTLTKEPALDPIDTDLRSLVSETIEGLDTTLRSSVVRHLEEVPAVRADPEGLRKVLVNLLLNALEASNGASVQVTTSRDSAGRVVLSVTDGGCGMTPEFIERSLFRPFRTTKSGGMGIGLFQSKRIVEAHRGRIEVESEVGQGSTFRVILPVASREGGI